MGDFVRRDRANQFVSQVLNLRHFFLFSFSEKSGEGTLVELLWSSATVLVYEKTILDSLLCKTLSDVGVVSWNDS